MMLVNNRILEQGQLTSLTHVYIRVHVLSYKNDTTTTTSTCNITTSTDTPAITTISSTAPTCAAAAATVITNH